MGAVSTDNEEAGEILMIILDTFRDGFKPVDLSSGFPGNRGACSVAFYVAFTSEFTSPLEPLSVLD